jgi:NAD-dependent dihydropyrimidine dehydrogenase PreA subunit/DNA-binding Lrp family transcriptional regulator
MMPIREELKAYAMRLGFPESENLGGVFSILFDDEESVRLVQALPGSLQELSDRTGLPPGRVREMAEKLKQRGAINRVLAKPDHYRLFPAMIELRDSSIMDPDAPLELFVLWDKLIHEEMPVLVSLLKALNPPPMMRVIPIERSVESQGQVLDIDSARKMFKDAELITAIPCPCRMQARKVGKGKDCPAPPTSMCMQIGQFGAAILDRGLGERLTNEEALKRLGEAEDAGLVHLIRNNWKKDMFMCNCCSCCCTGLFMINQAGYAASYAPSRFRVKLDADLCTGCGICEDRCQFHAIAMNGVALIDPDKCYGCGNCVIKCPAEALVLEEIRSQSHIRIT